MAVRPSAFMPYLLAPPTRLLRGDLDPPAILPMRSQLRAEPAALALERGGESRRHVVVPTEVTADRFGHTRRSDATSDCWHPVGSHWRSIEAAEAARTGSCSCGHDMTGRRWWRRPAGTIEPVTSGSHGASRIRPPRGRCDRSCRVRGEAFRRLLGSSRAPACGRRDLRGTRTSPSVPSQHGA